MNGASFTQSITTIGEAPVAAPEAPSENAATEAAPPAKSTSTSEGASGAATKQPERDPNLDLAKKFERVAQKETGVRRAQREAQEKLQGLTEREKKLAEREAELEEALGDPVGYMLKKGTDPVKVAERYAKPETLEEKRIRKLEEAEEKRLEEDADRKKAWEQDQHRQAKEHALRSFIGSISTKECPNLTTLYQASEVPALVQELLNRPADPEDPRGPSMQRAFFERHDRNPSDAEIRECLEYEAEVRATRIIELHRSASAARDGAVATSPGSTAQDSSKNESGPNGISNKHAASSTTAARKPPSLEEKRKKARKELTAALEAEVDDE